MIVVISAYPAVVVFKSQLNLSQIHANKLIPIVSYLTTILEDVKNAIHPVFIIH
jgi:hypothetical protein